LEEIYFRAAFDKNTVLNFDCFHSFSTKNENIDEDDNINKMVMQSNENGNINKIVA
jgi:hypothetical protein